MPVNSTHKQYDKAKEIWRTTRDAAEGQDAIKRGDRRYLPDFVPPNEAEYELLKSLAYYVNVTGRTRNALVGAVFRKDPEIELPSSLEYMSENADGAGSSLVQLSKKVVNELMTVGRRGLLADYPQVDGVLSQEEVRRRGLQASIKSYNAEDILNWAVTVVDGVSMLSMVVLKEEVEEEVDAYSSKCVEQYRVLMLVDGMYEQHVYDKELMPVSMSQPTMGNGERWKIIPFVLCGADNNLPDVDTPPLFDLANINIAHYRNVADVENSLRIFSRVMLHVDIGEMSTAEWDQLNPNGVSFGSSFGLQTIKGNASIIQAQPHNFGTEAVKDKEQQMVSVGARLITTNGANETAETARINASSEHSVLETLVGNGSEAIEQASEYCAMFMGADPEQVKFNLNRDFFDTKLDAQEYMALIQFADRGDIAQSDVRNVLRKTGVISDTRTDDDIDSEAETTAPI